MTREEAISNLRDIMGGIPFGKSFDEQFDACCVAIRSIEAWDKVLDFLYMTEDSFMNTRNIIEKGILQHNKNTIEIIEKCIEEVES